MLLLGCFVLHASPGNTRDTCVQKERRTQTKNKTKKNGVKINRKSQAMWRANKKRPKPHNTKAMKNNNEIEAKQFGVSSNRRAEKKHATEEDDCRTKCNNGNRTT